MAQFDLEKQALVGAGGLLSVREDDEITRKLSMLIEGECEGLGPIAVAVATKADAEPGNTFEARCDRWRQSEGDYPAPRYERASFTAARGQLWPTRTIATGYDKGVLGFCSLRPKVPVK